MFDEQPDGDPHGECAAEINDLLGLLKWAYGKLQHYNFTSMGDALALDEIKLKLMQSASSAAPVARAGVLTLCKHDDGDCHKDDPCDNCPVYRAASVPSATEGQK